MLAALAQTSSDNEMLLYIVDKDSGAELLKPHKLWHDTSATRLQMIRPFENENTFWVDESTLFIGSGFHNEYACQETYG